MRLRPYQQAAVNAVFNEWYQEGHNRTLAVLPTGCHAVGQKLLLADGSVKAVENISLDDRLMGADGTPRRILMKHTGNDTLYRIISTRRKTPSFSYGDIRRVLFTGIEPAQSTKLCKSPCKIIIFAI